MTERIADRFEHLSARRRTALVAYALAGDPDPARGADILRGLAGAADVLEIGVPCRAPLRDGPGIRAAHARALASGADWTVAIDAARTIRGASPDLPIILLLYAETVRAAGPGPFFQAAAEAGVDGLLVVDLAEKALPWWAPMAAMAGVALIPIVSPDTPETLLREWLDGARRFVYCAGAAATGGGPPDPAALKPFLERIQTFTDMPRVLGFGIRTPAIAAEMSDCADGLAVGTAFVEAAHGAVGAGGDPAAAVRTLAEDFSRALRKGG